jgi:hypothetical protein
MWLISWINPLTNHRLTVNVKDGSKLDDMVDYLVNHAEVDWKTIEVELKRRKNGY